MRLKTLCDDAKEVGKREKVIELTKKGLLTVSQAAKENGVTEEEIEKMVNAVH